MPNLSDRFKKKKNEMKKHIKHTHSLSGQDFLCQTCSCKIICSVPVFKKHLKSTGNREKLKEDTSSKEQNDFFVCQVCPKQRKHPSKNYSTHLKSEKHRT